MDEYSDQAVRVEKIIAQAETVFMSKDKAMNWLQISMKRFDGKTPMEMITTDSGRRLVEEALIQIDEGYFS